MGTMKYKGYTGSVDFSDEDNCLYGKVLGMSKDAITYEGSDVNELRKDFEGAIDDYIASCAQRGIEPRKPFCGNLNVRITPEIQSHSYISSRSRHNHQCVYSTDVGKGSMSLKSSLYNKQ